MKTVLVCAKGMIFSALVIFARVKFAKGSTSIFVFACYLHLSHFQGYLRQGSDKEVGSKGGCGKEAEHLVREAQFQAGINVKGKICFLEVEILPRSPQYVCS